MLVVEGGKAQLQAAVEVLASLAIDIPVIGLAKRHGELFLKDTVFPVSLPPASAAALLLTHLRHEARIFASLQREKRLPDPPHPFLGAIRMISPRAFRRMVPQFGDMTGL